MATFSGVGTTRIVQLVFVFHPSDLGYPMRAPLPAGDSAAGPSAVSRASCGPAPPLA